MYHRLPAAQDKIKYSSNCSETSKTSVTKMATVSAWKKKKAETRYTRNTKDSLWTADSWLMPEELDWRERRLKQYGSKQTSAITQQERNSVVLGKWEGFFFFNMKCMLYLCHVCDFWPKVEFMLVNRLQLFHLAELLYNNTCLCAMKKEACQAKKKKKNHYKQRITLSWNVIFFLFFFWHYIWLKNMLSDLKSIMVTKAEIKHMHWNGLSWVECS